MADRVMGSPYDGRVLTLGRYAIRTVKRDGEYLWKLRCPDCDEWGDVDYDQFAGRVSIDHEGCSFHETVNLAELLCDHLEGAATATPQEEAEER